MLGRVECEQLPEFGHADCAQLPYLGHADQARLPDWALLIVQNQSSLFPIIAACIAAASVQLPALSAPASRCTTSLLRSSPPRSCPHSRLFLPATGVRPLRHRGTRALPVRPPALPVLQGALHRLQGGGGVGRTRRYQWYHGGTELPGDLQYHQCTARHPGGPALRLLWCCPTAVQCAECTSDLWTHCRRATTFAD